MQNLNFENATVLYNESYLDKETSGEIFDNMGKLLETEDHKKVVDNNGKPIYKLNRKTLVLIDKDIDKTIIPKLWGHEVTIVEFPVIITKLKQKLEAETSFKFNICLVNYYDSGKRGIGFHSDSEEKGSTSCIASISIGAPRNFYFRKKNSKEIYKTMSLNSGSLLLMQAGCQENYEHALLPDKTCVASRLNLTFRLFDASRYQKY